VCYPAGMLDADTCYRALLARDRRFDGVFFVGVTSTRVYCRPVCTVRPPRRENCRFYPDAARAEAAGFRPCLRCRPELAPGRAAVDAAERIAGRAARRIEDGALNEGGVTALAAEFGMSPRQLRRVVRRELGITPVELAQTQRLLFAKRLLTDTDLPVTHVAFASGFGSLRRFNALFRERYRLCPSRLRERRRAGGDPGVIRSELAYRPPLAWRPLLSFLAARTVAGVEAVCGGAYLRAARLGDHVGWLRVRPHDGRPAVVVEVSASLAPCLVSVLAGVKRLFDLSASPDTVDAHLAGDPTLAASVSRAPGVRVPGAFDGFEAAVRAVLGQQVSVRAATTLAGRVAARFGELVETPFPGLTHTFPPAPRLAAAATADLTALGLTAARAAAVVTLARAVADGLTLRPGGDVCATLDRLRALPGFGEWTCQYVAMRALHWPDAFVAGDLGVRSALGGPTPRQATERAEAWRPWRAYAVMRLWLGPEVEP
jgi:AraC family transcriptional regulator of adaptative response / DNA-3-methyladenine glycosylase II